MTVEIVDGRVVGYLTIKEYAKKHFSAEATVRMWIYRGKLKILRIGNQDWIKEDEPYPTDRRRRI